VSCHKNSFTKSARPPARLLWPKEQALTLARGDKWRVRVPEVALYAIVAIELD
jgi:hypothetical protein